MKLLNKAKIARLAAGTEAGTTIRLSAGTVCFTVIKLTVMLTDTVVVEPPICQYWVKYALRPVQCNIQMGENICPSLVPWILSLPLRARRSHAYTLCLSKPKYCYWSFQYTNFLLTCSVSAVPRRTKAVRIYRIPLLLASHVSYTRRWTRRLQSLPSPHDNCFIFLLSSRYLPLPDWLLSCSRSSPRSLSLVCLFLKLFSFL